MVFKLNEPTQELALQLKRRKSGITPLRAGKANEGMDFNTGGHSDKCMNWRPWLAGLKNRSRIAKKCSF